MNKIAYAIQKTMHVIAELDSMKFNTIERTDYMEAIGLRFLRYVMLVKGKGKAILTCTIGEQKDITISISYPKEGKNERPYTKSSRQATKSDKPSPEDKYPKVEVVE